MIFKPRESVGITAVALFDFDHDDHVNNADLDFVWLGFCVFVGQVKSRCICSCCYYSLWCEAFEKRANAMWSIVKPRFQHGI